MKRTELIMGMPVNVEIRDDSDLKTAAEHVFNYFRSIDRRFSTYKADSEISAINRGEIRPEQFSVEMVEVFRLSAETKELTRGYFDIRKPDGSYDPSGLVKGWAIHKAAGLLRAEGYGHFFIAAGGDIQASVRETFQTADNVWKVGIRNPFNRDEVVKVLGIRNEGVATSGTYIRGQHIYNPHNPGVQINDVVSITVIGPNIYEADRFATAAFAMGAQGIAFIEELRGFEGYQIAGNGIATMTTNFNRYVVS